MGMICKRLRASSTIEMAYIMPIIFLVILVTTYLGFFFHDKNMLQAIVYETLIIAENQCRNEGAVLIEKLETYIIEQSEYKMLYFDSPILSIAEDKDKITIIAEVEKNNMNIKVDKTMPITEPEKEIRKARRIQGVFNDRK